MAHYESEWIRLLLWGASRGEQLSIFEFECQTLFEILKWRDVFDYFRFEMGIFGEITSKRLCRYESFWENNNVRKSFVESLLTFSRIWGGTSSKNSNFKKCWRINTELIFCLILKIIHFVIMDLMVLLQRFVTKEFLINVGISGGM